MMTIYKSHTSFYYVISRLIIIAYSKEESLTVTFLKTKSWRNNFKTSYTTMKNPLVHPYWLFFKSFVSKLTLNSFEVILHVFVVVADPYSSIWANIFCEYFRGKQKDILRYFWSQRLFCHSCIFLINIFLSSCLFVL